MFTTTDWSPFLRKSTHIFFILFLPKDQFEAHVHEDLLNVYTYYGSERTKDTKLLAEQDVVLTTYQTLSSEFSKVWPYIHMHFFLEKSMLESGWVQQNIPATAAKHTAEFPSHILSGWTPFSFPLATRRAHGSESFARENIQSDSTDWPFWGCAKKTGTGSVFCQIAPWDCFWDVIISHGFKRENSENEPASFIGCYEVA